MDAKDFLEHHGVKGQKWGIRNARNVKVSSVDHRTAHKLNDRPVSSLSNKQLQTVNNRLNLEQNHARLNPSKHARGKRHVEQVLGTAGLAVGAYNLVKSPAGLALVKSGSKFTAKYGSKLSSLGTMAVAKSA